MHGLSEQVVEGLVIGGGDNVRYASDVMVTKPSAITWATFVVQASDQSAAIEIAERNGARWAYWSEYDGMKVRVVAGWDDAMSGLRICAALTTEIAALLLQIGPPTGDMQATDEDDD